MFKKIMDKALGKDADKADLVQMIVLIDYKPMFCDYANFSKYDPDWWMELADDVKSNSASPELAIGLYAIAASQYFFDGPYQSSGRAKEALMRGMSFKKEHPVLMTIGKGLMLADATGENVAVERSEIEKEGLASAKIAIEVFENLIQKSEQE